MSEPVELVVYGIPMSKGSKTAMTIGGKARMIDAAPARSKDPDKRREQRRRLKAWPEDTARAAREAMMETIDGPVNIAARFFMPRPKSRKNAIWHTTKPDLDKLLRGLLDPLVVGGLLRDDCLVVSFSGSEKRYAALGALLGDSDGPRVEITVSRVPESP